MNTIRLTGTRFRQGDFASGGLPLKRALTYLDQRQNIKPHRTTDPRTAQFNDLRNKTSHSAELRLTVPFDNEAALRQVSQAMDPLELNELVLAWGQPGQRTTEDIELIKRDLAAGGLKSLQQEESFLGKLEWIDNLTLLTDTFWTREYVMEISINGRLDPGMILIAQLTQLEPGGEIRIAYLLEGQSYFHLSRRQGTYKENAFELLMAKAGGVEFLRQSLANIYHVSLRASDIDPPSKADLNYLGHGSINRTYGLRIKTTKGIYTLALRFFTLNIPAEYTPNTGLPQTHVPDFARLQEVSSHLAEPTRRGFLPKIGNYYYDRDIDPDQLCEVISIMALPWLPGIPADLYGVNKYNYSYVSGNDAKEILETYRTTNQALRLFHGIRTQDDGCNNYTFVRTSAGPRCLLHDLDFALYDNQSFARRLKALHEGVFDRDKLALSVATADRFGVSQLFDSAYLIQP
ncbi:MAG: hypothetical protein ABH823_05510 [bacterium]